MTSTLSRTLVRLALIGAVSFVVPARAQELDTQIQVSLAERFEAEADQIYALELSGDPASKIDLARLLMHGTITSPTNPLPRPDLDRAETLLDEVIAGTDNAQSQRALSLKADLLKRRDTPESLDEREAIEAKLLGAGYAPAIADMVLAGVPLPDSIDLTGAIAALEAKVLSGDAKATEALSKLIAATDPERSKALAAQALMMSMSASENSLSAAVDMGNRYLEGQGVASDPAEGFRLLQAAAAKGSNEALETLDKGIIDGVPGLERSAVRDTVVAALAAGSTVAAEIIVFDFVRRPVYGFSRDDALVALRLQRETGDREALLRSVQFYASGGEAAPDLQSAIPLIEQLIKTEGQPAEEVMRVALKLEAVGLPIQLSLKYLEPMFRSVGGPGADEANYQADRILAAAAEAGIPAARSIPPDRRTAIVAELRDAGTRGHVRSLILLGDLYYAGIWVSATYRQAMQYYEQALAIEPTQAARERVAKALLQIKSTPFEEERFETLISELAASGSDWGQYRYGLLLIAGTGKRAPDVAAGEALLLQLSTKGFSPAVKAMIGRLRESSDAARMDEAIEAFTAAWALRKDYRTGRQLGEFYILAGRPADARTVLGHPMFARDPDALLALARMEAQSIPANEAQAYELAKRGLAATGDDGTAVELAQLLASLTLPEARAEGGQRLEAMAGTGNTDAISQLVASYFTRLKTDPSVLETVLDWTVTLAKAGEVAPISELTATYLAPDANPEIARQVLPAAEGALKVLPPDSYVGVLVARAYYNGWGTSPDVAHGNALIEASAAAGSSDALTELGLQYFYGMGRDRNSEIGVALLDSAALLGHDVARVELGRLNSSATGPSVDRVRAYSMFLDAAKQGSSAGMLEVGRLYMAGWGIGRDEARGVEWLERAAALGNFDAMYQLYFHYYSKPDPASQKLARLWLDRSVDAGVNPARLRLAVHLLSTEGDTPGSSGYDDAVTLLNDAFADGYNKARKFSQTTTAFTLPMPGEETKE